MENNEEHLIELFDEQISLKQTYIVALKIAVTNLK